jgi:hypothetical protein
MSLETEYRVFANKKRSQINGLCPDSEKNERLSDNR